MRRLPDRAAKNEQRRDREISGVTGDASEFLGHLLKDNGAGRRPRHQDSEHETEIAEAIRDERFLRCLGRGVALEPMADQQIGTHAHEFPEDEHHDEVVRKNDPEHREHEEGERSEVAGLAGVVLHVAERIDVDERADAGDEHEHGLAQIVEDQSQRHIEKGRKIDPG